MYHGGFRSSNFKFYQRRFFRSLLRGVKTGGQRLALDWAEQDRENRCDANKFKRGQEELCLLLRDYTCGARNETFNRVLTAYLSGPIMLRGCEIMTSSCHAEQDPL